MPTPATNETTWYNLDTVKTAERLGVRIDQGLPETEAVQRLETHGKNKLAEVPPTPPWKIFIEQFKGMLIMLLMGAAVLAALIGHVRDAIVIMTVTLFNSVLGFYQEYRAERSLAALKSMLTPHARVRRGGREFTVDAESLVPGDMVLLETGDRIAADGRIIESHSLEIDESALTGESHPVLKKTNALDGVNVQLADRVNMAFMNTVVTRGRGWMLVTHTGGKTVMGNLAQALATEEEGETPLQNQLEGLGHRLSYIAGVIVAGIFVLGWFKGTPLAEMVIQSIALAVAAIPEGLPAVVTVTLSLGMRRMVKAKAIVKRLLAVETLGCVTVICSDKTGTLTLNQMTARGGFFRGVRFSVSGEGYLPQGVLSVEGGAATPDWAPLMRPLALCNDSSVDNGVLSGDPTEGALLTLAYKGGIRLEQERERTPRFAEIPFESSTRYMGTFHKDNGKISMHVKGAPEQVLARCNRWLGPKGEEPLTPEVAQRIDEENRHLARQGYRVLAVAGNVLSEANLKINALTQHATDLVFLGVVGLMDPPRPEARDAIALCREAGIQVKMITGDQPDTALAIARELGMVGRMVTGMELDKFDEKRLSDEIEEIDIFARVSPEHKLRIVRALKTDGHVVAMTGDGVNDAPALKSADIGVAMGITGTEVAKEAASMVLTDDNFATIVRAVEEGRGIYDNIIKFVRFQLSTNLGAISSVVAALLMGLPEPFNPIQILWINIIMDGPPAMSLGVDVTSKGVMKRMPRAANDNILRLLRLLRLLFFGLLMAVGTLGVMMWVLNQDPGNRGRATTLAFTTFVFFQFFNAFNARFEYRTAFNAQFFTNRPMWASLIGVALLQVLGLIWEPAREVFHTTALDSTDWAVSIGVASSILLIEEIRKLIMHSYLNFQRRSMNRAAKAHDKALLMSQEAPISDRNH